MLIKISKSKQSRKQYRIPNGFTIIEIMVSVAILGILIAIAIPSFSNTIKRFRISAIRDELTASLQLARSEAIRRGTQIIVARNTVNCVFDMPDSQDWHCGWRLVVDTNNNGNINSADEVIQNTTLPAGYMLGHPNAGSPSKIIANRWGQFSPLANRFVVSPIATGVSDPETLTICISSGGRIRYIPDDVDCPL
jgi:type IV fimbrial biogenesis protein FimT